MNLTKSKFYDNIHATNTKKTGTTNAKIHELRCVKSIGDFKSEAIYDLYIQKMSGGDNRYMVYTRSGIETRYRVFNDKTEIEKHFEELSQ